jgi:hypothetical protein
MSSTRHWSRFAPAVAVLVAGVSLAVAVYRGTAAASVPLEIPASPHTTKCQLQVQQGRKQIECVLLVAQPIDRVWARVTNYSSGSVFESWFGRYLIESATPQAGSGEGERRTHLKARMEFWLSTYRVDTFIEEKRDATSRTASWDPGSNTDSSNRGQWHLGSATADTTNVRYTMDLSLPWVPAFVVRVLLLDNLGPVVEQLAIGDGASG